MTASASANPVLGALASGVRLHEYEIIRVLGHGGFGITYLARDSHLEKNFAIKEYLPTDLAARGDAQSVTVRSPDSRESFDWGRDQFVKEARVLARFDHPNIIQVHRFFEANKTAYFVMEYAEGVTLDQILRQENIISEARFRAILMPILDGLEVVHRGGVLHRDIKPSNIIMRSDGTPVLIDFGAARQNLSSLTRSVMSLVTAGYAPIEQYSSTGSQGAWTDLYALAAVAYRATLGKRPVDSVSRLRSDPLEPAVEFGKNRCSPNFLAAIDWAMAVHEPDRPKNIGEWRLALEGAMTPPRPKEIEVKPSKPVPLAEPPAAATKPAAPVARTVTRTAPMTAPKSAAARSTPPAVPKPAPRPAPAPAAAPAAAPGAAATAAPGGWRSWLPAAAVVLVLLVLVETYWLFMGSSRAPAPEEPAVTAPAIEAPAPTPAPVAQAPALPEEKIVAAQSGPGSTTGAPAVPLEPAPAAAEPAKSKRKPKPVPSPATPAAGPAPATKPAPVAIAAAGIPVGEMKPLSTFQDCPACPLMVALPAGHFRMGSKAGNGWEGPEHDVNLRKPIAIGRYEVSSEQWRACVEAKACAPTAGASGSGRLPAINVSWRDAHMYTDWLSRSSGRHYRLPSEAEWEYAIRAGTTSARFWGEDRRDQCLYANGADKSTLKTLSKGTGIADCDDHFPNRAPIGSFKPNAFGLHDMAGNVWEWTQDCWRETHAGAPRDGSAVEREGCDQLVIRGGSWSTKPESFRSANRGLGLTEQRGDDLGFRVVAE